MALGTAPSGLTRMPHKAAARLLVENHLIAGRASSRTQGARRNGIETYPGRKLQKMEEADVVFVVEIESRAGERATKEYDASSVFALDVVVRQDLRPYYPAFRVVKSWAKESLDR
jgi:hypothetical protein